MTRRPAPTLSALSAALAAALLCAGPLAAQQPPASTAPSPAQTAPLPTTTAPNPPADPNRSAAPAPEQAVTPPPAGQTVAGPAGAGQAASGASARPTLIEKAGEPGDVDEVTLPAKPAAILPGKAKWEDAVPSLRKAFAQIEADLAKLGVAPAGHPLAVFTRTDDDGFEFEAMIPVGKAPDKAPDPAAGGDGLRFGTTPSGKALRFAHRGSYESIDSTYETLTAYLDAKDIVVQDRFVEEYATDLKDGTDDALDVNIYALLK